MKNNIKINLEQFYKQYNLQERNYNLIISSPNGYGKFEFIEAVMEKYFQNHNVNVKSDVFAHPDVYYLSLSIIYHCPLYHYLSSIQSSFSLKHTRSLARIELPF